MECPVAFCLSFLVLGKTWVISYAKKLKMKFQVCFNFCVKSMGSEEEIKIKWTNGDDL